MRCRQPLPRLWLMTDARMGDSLWRALDRLPRGAGVVFRHYSLVLDERRALFAEVAHVAKRRRLVLLRAGDDRLGRHEQGVHNGPQPRTGLWTRAVHCRRDVVRARRDKVDLIFASPVFPTESHPGAPALGPVRFAAMIRDCGIPVIALGGMTPRRVRALGPTDIHGWAAIGWWTREERHLAGPDGWVVP